jgi:hypothetical protein
LTPQNRLNSAVLRCLASWYFISLTYCSRVAIACVSVSHRLLQISILPRRGLLQEVY